VRGSSGLHFHLINPKTGHRIRMVSQDADTDEEVSRSDLVKGYEFEKDRYVLLDDDDFEQARIDSSSTLTIGKFVDVASIDPIVFDTSYYVAPDGEAGLDVFVVLRDAIRKSHTAALSRVLIARPERAVAIIPSGEGLVCHTLHDPKDLWDAGPLFADLADVKPETDIVGLATQLIERQNGTFQPDDTEDRYEAKVREFIDAKLKGEGPRQRDRPEGEPGTGESAAREKACPQARVMMPTSGRRDGWTVT
jgi:DNA end-binding protein Ku